LAITCRPSTISALPIATPSPDAMDYHQIGKELLG
jgi:hypothetical protein